ncbi:MAG: aminodeoxychorismate/anthranilate synthase component II [bacterium]|nr:aminodeoxychorismate/anthranilate synthase component II [bacterium]
MKVLVIDNYDSFTYNLVQYLGELGAEISVARNDELTVEGALALQPDRILISPGPCTPQEAGISVPLIQAAAGKVPILGVCLGHQAIGAAFGGTIIRAKHPMHGKESPVRHTNTSVFRGTPNPLRVIRYHSLVIERATLPDCLEITAESEDDGEIMGVRHKEYPIAGVQFHPESILSEAGMQILRNFLADGE